MLNPLDALVITFGAMSVVSVAGVLLMNLSKNKKMKKGLFYAMSVWGLVVAGCGVLSGNIATAVLLGALSIAAIGINGFVKNENKFKIAKVLTSVSVVAGMINCFLI